MGRRNIPVVKRSMCQSLHYHSYVRFFLVVANSTIPGTVGKCEKSMSFVDLDVLTLETQ